MALTVFMIAGEPSGDVLGGALIKALKSCGEEVEISGIGGGAMKKEGLETLLPMEELSVMGVVEVISHLPRLYKLGMGIVEEIEKRQPDVLVTIDLPGFNNKVAQILRRRGKFKGKILHYVAPSVWAWKPWRAKSISGFLDGLLSLFPFEPEYFTKHGLKAFFVGHPIVEIDRAKYDGAAFREAMEIPAEVPCICLLMGSREREIKMMSNKLLGVLDILYEQYPDMHIVAPTLPQLEFNIQEALDSAKIPVHIVTGVEQKWQAFAGADVAIAVSGTVGLELAYMQTPHVIVYEMNPLTALIVKLMVKTKFAHLANILLGRAVVPEFIQEKFKFKTVAKEVIRLLRDPELRKAQLDAFKELDAKLRPDETTTPSEKAAVVVIKAAQATQRKVLAKEPLENAA